MKIARYIFITLIAILSAGLVCYCFFEREEWETRKRCAGCEALENQEQERHVGTVEILPNGKAIFTDQMLGSTYQLIACDANCETKELMSFSKIGVQDYATKQQIYFDIRGKYNPEKDEFVYNAVIVLNERKFVNPEEIKQLTFDKITEKHTALEEETFLLNESHYAGLREFLPHYFSEEQFKQPIAIKEATWEVNDSTLVTTWYIEKQKQWQLIEQYEWKKGTEF